MMAYYDVYQRDEFDDEEYEMTGSPKKTERRQCGCLFQYGAALVTSDSQVPRDFESGQRLERSSTLIFAIDSGWPRVRVCTMHGPDRAEPHE